MNKKPNANSRKKPQSAVLNDKSLSGQKRSDTEQMPRNQYWSQQNDKEQYQLKDRLNNIVQDYLIKSNYLKSLDQFEQEMNNIQNQDLQSETLLLEFFDLGERDQFFQLWDKSIPYDIREEVETYKLEFYLHIYFLIYPLHPQLAKGKNRVPDRAAMITFRQFLETKGKMSLIKLPIQQGPELSKTNEVLPYYAFPYVKNPIQHPSFQHLFTQEWVLNRRENLKDFLRQFQNLQQTSILHQLYLNQNKSGNIELQNYAENLGQINKQVQEKNQLLEQQVMNQQKAIQQLTDSARANLIESQQKWFSFTRDLAMITKDMIEHNQINEIPFSEQALMEIKRKLSQYEKFLNSNLDDLMSQSQDISLFERVSNIDQESNILPIQQQNQTEQYVSQDQQSNLTPLDYQKIIKLFTTSKNYVMISNVLQALRLRITKAINAYERRSVVVSYSQHDIIGTHQRNIALSQFLLLKSHPKIQEATLKLLNSLASDYSGRSYLTQSPQLIQFLIKIIRNEQEDSIKRKNAIGALQKLSLRRQPQKWMIEGNLIYYILDILRREKMTLSDYCYEYITALLMNLSLRASGKDQIEQNKELAFEVLIDLIECQNEQIRTFVNGTLYSLLSRKSICDYANMLNLNQRLQELHNNADERFQKQILYMIEQLNKEQADNEETLSDQIEENDVDDIDDEDEAAVEEDEDDELQDDPQVGENLLKNEFQLSGPEAQKQKFITDSIVLKELQQRAKYREQQNNLEIQGQGKIQDFDDIEIQNPSLHRSQQLESNKQSQLAQQQQQQYVNKQVQPKIKEGQASQSPITEVRETYAFQSRPKIPRTPPVFFDKQ